MPIFLAATRKSISLGLVNSKNYRLVLITALCLLLLPFSHSVEAQPAVASTTRHCLWKVQGKTNAIYLFGSVHFLTKRFYPLPAVIENAYQQSRIVAFETDIGEAQS